ncbi:MAG: hypothetical protein ACSLFR_11665 [Solirubrobacteraceae bacterium]
MHDEHIATPDETLADLLDRSKRSSVPIRRSFLRAEEQPQQPGPLAKFVRGRRALALDLWLLLHAGAAGGDWDVRQPAMSWARMLDMPQTGSSETTVSRNWSWLEERRLVRTERVHRVRNVYLLREDGSGRPFTRPTGSGRGFFKLPYAYFADRIHKDLGLSAKATLLICLAQAPTFTLPMERAASWYGVSPDTLLRGLDDLRDREYLKSWSRAKKAPRTRFGFTMENHYALLGPFARPPAKAGDR